MDPTQINVDLVYLNLDSGMLSQGIRGLVYPFKKSASSQETGFANGVFPPYFEKNAECPNSTDGEGAFFHTQAWRL